MTCIAAIVKNNKVWMGADSAGVGSYNLTVRGDKKIFINNGYLIGFTSSFRMGQLLRYRFAPPPCPDWDLEKHMTTTFIDEVRKCFKTYGFTKIDNNKEEGGCFLVATQGRLFTVHSDFQIGWGVDQYDAVGCGEDIAKGAINALLAHTSLAPAAIINRALTAAENHSGGVRGPFHFMSI